MNYEVLNLVQGSPDWINARFDHVTASNVSSLFGCNPYKTALEYGTELLTRVDKEDTANKDYIFRRGHAVEIAAREWCKANLGVELPPVVVRSLEIPVLMASLDGMDASKGVVFEAKFVGKDAISDLKRGVIKEHHRIQVQAQLLATGYDKAIYFAMDPDGEAAVMDIGRDAAVTAEISERVTKFWRDLKDGKLPEASEKDILQVEDADLVTLAALDAKASAAKKEYDALEDLVLARYADNGRVQGGGVSIVKYWQRGNIDYSKVSNLKGVDLDRYRKAGSFRTKVTIKEGA